MKNKLLLSLLSGFVLNAFADSGSFTVFPIQVVIDTPGKVKELTLVNSSDNVLNTQSTFKTYSQYLVKGQLVESNEIVSGAPAVVVTPVVMQDIKPNSKQAIRVLAVRQDAESEIAYRYYVKSLNPSSVDSSGTNFEIGYGLPVFVLPKNVHESYALTYATMNGKPCVKINNTGNVHILIKEVYAQTPSGKISIGTGGRILAGQAKYLPLAPSLTKSSQLQLSFAKAGLIDFEKESQVQLTINK